MSMTEELRAIVTETIGAVAIIYFNRPAERNPLSIAVLQQLEEAVLSSSRSDNIKTIIFMGVDDVFASGANIRELAMLDTQSATDFAKLGQALLQKIADARQLTIAAINGYCMGGGLDLALACDIRVASTNAVFAHPGVHLGIITGWGGTQRLPRAIGKARAIEFFATARRLDSTEALEIGLISRVADPVLDCALKIAGTIRK
jgi:enoyl-CoA hydratase